MIDYENMTGTVLGQDWGMVREVLVRVQLGTKIFNLDSPQNNLNERSDLEFSLNGSLLVINNTTSNKNNSTQPTMTEDAEQMCSFISINVSIMLTRQYWPLNTWQCRWTVLATIDMMD